MRNFVTGNSLQLFVSNVRFLCAFVLLNCMMAHAGDSFVTATNAIRELRALSHNDPAEIAFEFDGTVYYTNKHCRFFFLGNDRDFIRCEQNSDSTLALGDRVHVVGVSRLNNGNRQFVANKVTVLAQPGVESLLCPTEIDFSKLDSRHSDYYRADMDYQWVSSTALVQTISLGMGRTELHCICDNTPFHVNVLGIIPVEQAVDFVSAQIEFTGNLVVGNENEATTVFTHRQFVRLIEPGNQLAYRPIDSLTQLRADDTSRNFHLLGQITYATPHGFFFETADSGVWLDNDLGMEAVVGNYLDVYGIRDESNRFLPRLFSGGSAERLPQPAATPVKSILTGQTLNRRVKVRGKQIAMTKLDKNGNYRIDLDSNGLGVAVYLQPNLSERVEQRLKNAQDITVTGTAVLQSPEGFAVSLFTPSLDDILVESERNNLSSQWIVGLALVAGVLVIWFAKLRRRVNQQSRDLNQLNAELQSSFRAIRDGIIVLSPSQRVSQFNERASEILGIPLVAGVTTADDIEQNLRRNANNADFLRIWKTINQRTVDTVDLVSQLQDAKSGNVRTIELKSAPVRNGFFECDERMWTFHDITDKEQLYRRLTHAQKQETVGRMASGFAHDFNNLLTGIICNLTLAATDPNKTVGDVVGSIETAIGASKRASNLVSHILDFSKKRDPNQQTCNVDEFLDELTALLVPALPSRITVEHFVDPATPKVRIDRNQMEQVILNISMNAFHAIPKTGRITIRAFPKVLSEESKAAVAKNSELVKKPNRPSVFDSDSSTAQPNEAKTPDEIDEYVVISIQDTGTGMTEDVLKRIFEPYFTTKAESGTGLGLSMTKEIIREHSGFIECSSTPNVGTEFRIFLPAASKESTRILDVRNSGSQRVA